MGKTKYKETAKQDIAFDVDKIQVGDVVSIQWNDVHAYERIEISEINELEEPEVTRCWGAVVRKGSKYLFIASEIGDPESDGVWIEALPYSMIQSCKVIDSIGLNL